MDHNKMFIFATILISTLNFTNQLKMKHLNSVKVICDEFGIRNPTIVLNDDISLKLTKYLSNVGQYIKVIINISETVDGKDIQNSNSILMAEKDFNQIPPENLMKYSSIVMVLVKNVSSNPKSLSRGIQINQQIYFFDQLSNELFEVYMINNKKIRNKLGYVDREEFQWEKNVEPNFILRRSDFQGLTLKAMTEKQGSNIIIHDDYKIKAPFNSTDNTYMVNGFVSGLYFEILQELQEHLNFSTILFKRKVASWGFVYEEENGTIKGTGMVGDLLYKNADLVVTSLTAMVERAKHIDFMPPITPFEIGLSIANLDLTEEYDYDTFISPFNLSLWNTIFVFATLIGLTQCIISYFHHSLTLLNFFTFIWNSFVSNFGGRCFRLNMEDITSYKVSILTSLLTGTILWMAYRSHLTSELSIYEQRYPFKDMESFSRTKWR